MAAAGVFRRTSSTMDLFPMKNRFVSLAAVAAALLASVALNAADEKPEKGKGGGFVAADTDEDGKLSEAEFVAFFSKRMGGEEKAKEVFAKADTNTDTYLDRPEFRAQMEKMRAAGGGNKPEGGKKTSGSDT